MRDAIPLWTFLFLLIFFGFNSPDVESNHAYTWGEKLQFKLNYGWLSVGNGSFEIGDRPEDYEGRPCYRVTMRGASTGLLRLLAPVNDEWGAFVDMDDLFPLYSFRNIREGGYRLNEEVFIEPDSGTLRVESMKPHRKVQRRPTRRYELDPQRRVHDLLSGIMAVRDLEFNEIYEGDTLELKAFFEDTFYDFRIVYVGKEVLKTKLGRMRALKLIPLLPENAVFDGKHAVEAWLSDDRNKLPLRVSAKMFIGKASVELISYQNLKYAMGSE